MKSYNKYEDLLKDNNITFSSDVKHAEEKLEEFLFREGADEDAIQPIKSFTLNIEDKQYKLGVTSISYGDHYDYTYWLLD